MKTTILNRAAAALIALAAAAGLLFAGAPHAAAATEEPQSPPPAVLISRTELAPIPAGGTAQLTLQFQNLGDKALQSPIAVVTPSDGLSIFGESSSFVLNEIPAGGTGSVSLTLRAADAASADQSVGVELRFVCEGAAGTASDRVPVPVTPKAAAVQPTIAISRSAVSSPIRPGEEFTLNLSFENRGAVAASGMSAVITPSEGLTLLTESATLQLPDLAPGKSASVPVKLRGAREITSESQSLGVELRFSYESAGVPTAASQSDRLNIPARASAPSSSQKTDAPVPNIVVKSFTYGGKAAEAGGTFPLSIIFENTGTVRCENIVVTVDGGESFTVDGGTNTAHYKALAAGGNQTQTLNMQTVPTAKSGAQPITVSFKYEYLDGARRAAVTSDVRLTVPVSQPNRFEITPPSSTALDEGVEGELLFTYVNKGKGEIANLEAELVGEGFSSPARTQYLGNVAAGGSGNIGFALTPDASGSLKLTVKIRYEDADQKQQTAEFPLTAEVTPAIPEEPLEPMEEPSQGGFPFKPVFAGVCVVAAAVSVGAAVLHRKKKAAGTELQNWDWNSDEEE